MDNLSSISNFLDLSDEVKAALESTLPVVSLESHAVLQGIPYPVNLEIIDELYQIASQHEVTPALIGMLEGKIKIGYEPEEIERCLEKERLAKVGSSDIAAALSSGLSGGTTISATAFLSHLVGIEIFVAGGIGGVHAGDTLDVSADLFELSRNPILLVCSGAKAILDLPATTELLEALTIPVLGYQTDTFPGFFLRDTGVPLKLRIDEIPAIVDQFRTHKLLGRKTSVIVADPPPAETAFVKETFDPVLEEGYRLAEESGISGGGLTPFLLNHINDKYQGKLFEIITAVLLQNMELGCKIAKAYHQ